MTRPFQSAIHAKRTYRELRMLKHMQHENVRLWMLFSFLLRVIKNKSLFRITNLTNLLPFFLDYRTFGRIYPVNKFGNIQWCLFSHPSDGCWFKQHCENPKVVWWTCSISRLSNTQRNEIRPLSWYHSQGT